MALEAEWQPKMDVLLLIAGEQKAERSCLPDYRHSNIWFWKI